MKMTLLFAFLLAHGILFSHDLVDLSKFNPQIRIDMRLASTNSIFGTPVYPAYKLYVERFVATRLGRVQRSLAKSGIGLIVLEGYRPPSVQRRLNWLCPCTYAKDAPRFRRGMGVDVMPYYLDGQPIKIPSFYQEHTLRARRDYPENSASAYHNSQLLEQEMVKNGFVPQKDKWWHFDLKGWESVPDLEIEYAELE